MPRTEPVELSPLARMLNTWERRPAVPTEEVEAIIAATGFSCFAPWLAFHERYAGYVELFYQDGFVLGLAHRKPYWLAPNKVDIDSEGDGQTWYITCAEGHPTYSYRLDQSGKFLAHGGARSFDVYVERLAALREFAPRGSGTRDLPREEIRGVEFGALFADRIRPFLVDELSDQFWRYYINDMYLVIEDAEDGKLRRAWERATQRKEDL